jgi:hypothetical protein
MTFACRHGESAAAGYDGRRSRDDVLGLSWRRRLFLNRGLSGTLTVILDRGGLCLDSAQYHQLTQSAWGGQLGFPEVKGLGDKGRRLAAGVYVCALDGPGTRITRKVVLTQ